MAVDEQSSMQKWQRPPAVQVGVPGSDSNTNSDRGDFSPQLQLVVPDGVGRTSSESSSSSSSSSSSASSNGSGHNDSREGPGKTGEEGKPAASAIPQIVTSPPPSVAPSLAAAVIGLRRDLEEHHSRILTLVSSHMNSINTNSPSKPLDPWGATLSAKTQDVRIDHVLSDMSFADSFGGNNNGGGASQYASLHSTPRHSHCIDLPNLVLSEDPKSPKLLHSEFTSSLDVTPPRDQRTRSASNMSSLAQVVPMTPNFSAFSTPSQSRRTLLTPQREMPEHDEVAIASSHRTDATPTKRRGIFADVEGMKEQVRQNIIQPQYRVEDCYHTTGWCQWLARHTWFDAFTLGMVFLNSIWIGYDLDNNDSPALYEAGAGFQIVENLFCLFFVFEATIRLLAFRHKLDAFQDIQFLFDVSLSGLMVFETWVMYIVAAAQGGTGSALEGVGALSMLRMLRLIRIARLVRLLRAKQELMVLIKGLLAASRAVGWTFVLMVVIIYIFAVAFKILTGKSSVGKRWFKTIPEGMLTLTLPGLLPDNSEPIMSMGLLYGSLFMVFIIIGSITMMNMLIGVLCETVSATAAIEKEGLSIAYVRSELESLLDDLGKDSSDLFSSSDIEAILLSPLAGRCFNKVGVDVEGLVDIAEFLLFANKPEVSFADFLEVVLELRGTNVALVSHIVNLQKFIVDELAQLEARVVSRLPGQEPHHVPPHQHVRRSRQLANLSRQASKGD